MFWIIYDSRAYIRHLVEIGITNDQNVHIRCGCVAQIIVTSLDLLHCDITIIISTEKMIATTLLTVHALRFAYRKLIEGNSLSLKLTLLP